MYVAVLAVLGQRERRNVEEAAQCWVGLTPPSSAERLMAARADAGDEDLPHGYRRNPAGMLAARTLARGLRLPVGAVLGQAYRSVHLDELGEGFSAPGEVRVP